MYRIDPKENKLSRLDQPSFRDLGFKEREHLQEWIAKEPGVLGEELLIIQKEFAGFSDTQERLDLLALDKQASLVVIENKLDDSGRDVTWQALKYASYCSSLSKEAIEADFGGPLSWYKLKDKRACRIKAESPGNVFDQNQWEAMIAFMADSMARMERAFQNQLKSVNQTLSGPRGPVHV